MTELIQTWSKNTSEEDSMTEEHAWIWREMIKCIPSNDLSAARVLDVGCNQGGFLRTLYDTRPFAQGVGVDLAQGHVCFESRRALRRRDLLPCGQSALGDMAREAQRDVKHPGSQPFGC